LLAGSLPWSRIATSKPQPPDLASRFLHSGVNDCPGALQAIGGGTGWSRRGLGEATYNGAGVQSWDSGLSATQSRRSDPLKTAKNQTSTRSMSTSEVWFPGPSGSVFGLAKRTFRMKWVFVVTFLR